MPASWSSRRSARIGANPSLSNSACCSSSACSVTGSRVFGYPIAPVVVGLILGPLAEQQLRRALAISQGDPSFLFQSPLAITLYVIAATALLLPLFPPPARQGRPVLKQLSSDED